MKHSLQDLISYFHPPPETLDHEAKRHNMVVLKNRQNMFQEEVILLVNHCETFVSVLNDSSFQGVIDLVLDCIDHLHQHIGASQCAEAAQKDSDEEWESSLSGFYKLLGEISCVTAQVTQNCHLNTKHPAFLLGFCPVRCLQRVIRSDK